MTKLKTEIVKDKATGETFCIQFKRTESKGRNTAGWLIVKAYVDGKLIGKAKGGGYDMQGAALDKWAKQRKGVIIDGARGLTAVYAAAGVEWVKSI